MSEQKQQLKLTDMYCKSMMVNTAHAKRNRTAFNLYKIYRQTPLHEGGLGIKSSLVSINNTITLDEMNDENISQFMAWYCHRVRSEVEEGELAKPNNMDIDSKNNQNSIVLRKVKCKQRLRAVHGWISWNILLRGKDINKDFPRLYDVWSGIKNFNFYKSEHTSSFESLTETEYGSILDLKSKIWRDKEKKIMDRWYITNLLVFKLTVLMHLRVNQLSKMKEGDIALKTLDIIGNPSSINGTQYIEYNKHSKTSGDQHTSSYAICECNHVNNAINIHDKTNLECIISYVYIYTYVYMYIYIGILI